MTLDCKEDYRDLCLIEPAIPIFSQAWWLDAVCTRHDWDVVVAKRDGVVVGAMPYCLRKDSRFVFLEHPPLTQTLGPWFRPTTAKYARVLASQKEIMLRLIDDLPEFDYFKQSWSHQQTNWLPFYWRGFSQTTRYTYILRKLQEREFLWAGLEGNVRTDIRKAESRFGLRVRDDLGVEEFLALLRMTFSRQNMPLPYPEALIRDLDDSCRMRNCRKIFVAEDSTGRKHAAVYIVWDPVSAYYLMGGSDPELRSSGATSLCIWEAINFSATVTKQFDFEGSMREPIERYFRAFGAIQTPYFAVSKTPSRYLKARRALVSLVKRT